jgi:hypothetical protein
LKILNVNVNVKSKLLNKMNKYKKLIDVQLQFNSLGRIFIFRLTFLNSTKQLTVSVKVENIATKPI